MTPATPTFVHATAILLGEAGVLIQGVSGSGKTSLARALLFDASRQRGFARLVGDDRVGLVAYGDRLVGRPHPAIAGRMELRGIGIRSVEHEPACVVRVIVDLVSAAAELAPRCPDEPPSTSLLGVKLPVLTLRSSDGARENSGRVFAFMCALRSHLTESF